jgi:hypothetical protein
MTEFRRSETLQPYLPPADEQVIVWVEDQGTPVVLAICDKSVSQGSTTERYTYQAFIQRFGPRVAETAVQLYRMEHD